MLGPKGCSVRAGNGTMVPLRRNTFAARLPVQAALEEAKAIVEFVLLLPNALEGGPESSYIP